MFANQLAPSQVTPGGCDQHLLRLESSRSANSVSNDLQVARAKLRVAGLVMRGECKAANIARPEVHEQIARGTAGKFRLIADHNDASAGHLAFGKGVPKLR